MNSCWNKDEHQLPFLYFLKVVLLCLASHTHTSFVHGQDFLMFTFVCVVCASISWTSLWDRTLPCVYYSFLLWCILLFTADVTLLIHSCVSNLFRISNSLHTILHYHVFLNIRFVLYSVILGLLLVIFN